MKIYVNPGDVWDYFQKNKELLAERLDVIAEIEVDEGYELQVFVTEEDGYPLLSIEFEDDVLEKECAISEIDCTLVAKKFFKMLEEHKYDCLSDSQYDDSEIVTDNSLEAEYDVDVEYVDEREDELRLLLSNFLLEAMCVSEGAVEFDNQELSALLDEIEEAAYRTVECIMYRPRIIEDNETGQFRMVESIFDV